MAHFKHNTGQALQEVPVWVSVAMAASMPRCTRARSIYPRLTRRTLATHQERRSTRHLITPTGAAEAPVTTSTLSPHMRPYPTKQLRCSNSFLTMLLGRSILTAIPVGVPVVHKCIHLTTQASHRDNSSNNRLIATKTQR